jgi:homoserine dehydrogenase
LLQDKVGRHPLLQEIEIYRVGVRSLTKPRVVELSSGVITTDLEAIVNDPAVDIVVELMGGLEPARTLMLAAIKNGKHVITANKAVISPYSKYVHFSRVGPGV